MVVCKWISELYDVLTVGNATEKELLLNKELNNNTQFASPP